MKFLIVALMSLGFATANADEFKAEYCGNNSKENLRRGSKVKRVCLGELQGGVSSFLSGALIELKNGQTLTYDAFDTDSWDGNSEDELIIDDSGDQRYYLDVLNENGKPVRITGSAEYDQRVDVTLKPHKARKGIICQTLGGRVLLDWEVHGDVKLYVPELKKTIMTDSEESYVAQTDPSSKLLIEGHITDGDTDVHYEFEIKADLESRRRPRVTLMHGRKGIQYQLYCRPKAK